MVEAKTLAVFRYANLMRLFVVGFFVLSLFFSQGGDIAFAITTQSESTLVPPPAVPPVTQKVGEENVMMQWFHDFVINVAGSFVAVAGLVFDSFITNFIVEFGEHYKSSNLGFVIDNLWATVRDMFNLTFIFGLVYIGFQIILGTNEAEAKRTIPKLIIAALLVNFSLFFVKFIIDFANIAAVQIYNLFDSVGGTGVADGTVGGVTTGSSAPSIAQGFLNAIGASHMMSLLPAGSQLLYIFSLLVIFIILIYVFLMGAILVAIRFAVLCMYLVFSPIMFIGWVFPSFDSYNKKYWEGLLGQAFFAPAFLFMLYLSFRIVDTFNDQGSSNSMRAGLNTAQSVAQGSVTDVTGALMSVFPFFIMTVVFLLASMSVAKSMSERGSKMSISAVQKMKAWGGSAVFGGAAIAGQYTLGAGAQKLTQNDTFKDVTSRFGRVGRSFYNTTAAVGDGSMDLRRVANLGKDSGLGEGAKGGFATSIKKQKEADEKFFKDVGTREADKYDIGTDMSASLAALAAEETTKRDELRALTDTDQARDALDATISANEAALAAAQEKKKKARYPDDIAAADAEISRLETDIATQRATRGAMGTKETIDARRKELEKELTNNANQKKLTEAKGRGTKALRKELDDLEDKLDKETDVKERAKISEEIKNKKAEYDYVKNSWAARNEYSRQLNYMAATEKWQRTQVLAATVVGGTAATILTGGLAGGLAGAAIGAGVGLGNRRHNTVTSGAMRKEYGSNGVKMRRNHHEEHNLKKAMAALAGNHGAAPAPAPTPVPAAAGAAPAPAADPHGH